MTFPTRAIKATRDMGTFILRRLMNLAPVLAGISLAAFVMLYVLPGDPAEALAPQSGDPLTLQQARARHRLDDPLPARYLAYLGRLLRGDMGESVQSREPVASVLLAAFFPTAQLAVGSLLFALALGLTAGVLSAARPRTWVDGAAMLVALAGVSMPVFWLGMMLIVLNARLGSFFVVSDYQPFSVRFFALPCAALGTVTGALLARLTRSSLLEAMGRDFIRTARAKGVAEWRVLLRHGLRNAAAPIVTVIGASLAGLLSGAVLTETVFGIPGLGSKIVQGITDRDYPVIVGAVLWLAVTFVIVNLIVDILYVWLDPRIRYD